MSTEQIDRYVKTFQDISNISQLNQLLMTLSKQVPDNYSLRVNENYLYGCQSDIWLSGNCEQNRWQFQLDSDSQLVKGMGKLILDCVNHLTSEQIYHINYFTFRQIASKLPQQKQKSLQIIINRIHNITGYTT